MANTSYTYSSGGKTYIATPTASTTAAQKAAVASNPAYTPVTPSGSSGQLISADGKTIATPNANVTPQQVADAQKSGFSPIPVSTLTTPVSPIVLPPANTPTNLMSTITGNNAALGSVGANGLLQTPTNTPPSATDSKSILKEYLSSLKAPTNQADMYRSLQNETGILEKRQTVQNLTNTLNAITAKANADILSTTGQGRGIPEAIIGGQQAQISKEAAIRALPVQAQLAAAQGDLQLAQSTLDTLFKIHISDAENETNYYNKQVEAVYNFATSEEKRQLDNLKADKSTNLNRLNNSVNQAQTLTTLAINKGDAALASRIASITPPSPSSSTFESDLAAYDKQVASLAGSFPSSDSTGVSEKVLAKIQASPEYRTINGILPAIQDLTAYKDAINTYGTTELVSGEGAGKLSAAYANALATWKTLAGLGALSGADFALSENAIPEKGLFKRVSTSISALNTSIDKAVTQAENLTRRLIQTHPEAAPLLNAQLDDMKLTAYPEKYTRAPDGTVIEIIK